MTAPPGLSRRALACAAAATLFAGGAGAEESGAHRRVLVYGASNAWGFLPRLPGQPLERLPFERRWPGVAQRRLGRNVIVLEDALPGRTAGVDRPGFGALAPSELNGLTELPAALARNAPVHLVVLQLGTNDLMLDPEISPQAFAARIVDLARAIGDFRLPFPMVGMSGPARVLALTPPPIGDTPGNPNGFRAEAKRQELGRALWQASRDHGFLLFDTDTVAMTPGADGLHFAARDHEALGRRLAPAICAALAS